MEFLSNFPWTQGSAVTLLAAVFIMFLKGLIIPRSWVDKMLESSDEVANHWHNAYLESQETSKIQSRQIESLLEIAKRDSRILAELEAATTKETSENGT